MSDERGWDGVKTKGGVRGRSEGVENFGSYSLKYNGSPSCVLYHKDVFCPTHRVFEKSDL